MTNIYRSQIKKFKKGKQTAPVDISNFKRAYSDSVRSTAKGKLKALHKKMGKDYE